MEVKALCDRYYSNPPVSVDEIKHAHLHMIYVINMDNATVQEIDPDTYIDTMANCPYSLS